MSENFAKFEGYVSGDGNPKWNQSYYYNVYDPETRSGVLVRAAFLENQAEANCWFIVFKDGLPVFTRTNMNLPYTADRPAGGVELAGMRIVAEVPLKRTRITFDSPDFQAEFVWEELQPLEDCIAMSQDEEGSFNREIAHIHLEGTSTGSGWFSHRGTRYEMNGKGFRDIAAGPRNWDALLHYRLSWPIFDNGVSISAIRGVSTSGKSAYMRMLHDGTAWRRITRIEDEMTFGPDGLSMESARWVVVDELGREWGFTAKPLFRWLFPLDTFVLCEQLAEFRLDDGTVGYGLYESGYRLPWKGIDA